MRPARSLRISAANSSINFCDQNRIVSWLTSVQRWCCGSSTLLEGKGSNKEDDCEVDHLTQAIEVSKRTALEILRRHECRLSWRNQLLLTPPRIRLKSCLHACFRF